jgi:glutathione S-transferase
MAVPKIKITYFNMKGRAEVTRLCLAIAGIPFEDVRLTGEQFG